MHSPYEGPNLPNQNDRKLGVFDRKLQVIFFMNIMNIHVNIYVIHIFTVT